jgi:hypothetical protein
MNVEIYTPARKEEWDEFVEKSVNGTFMHSRQFLSYHTPGKFKDCSLLFFDNNKLLAVFPAADVEGKCLKSHPGATYGGLVVSERCSAIALADGRRCGWRWQRWRPRRQRDYHRRPNAKS